MFITASHTKSEIILFVTFEWSLCISYRKHLFQMFGYICLPNIFLSDPYLWICVEMFIVARVCACWALDLADRLTASLFIYI